MSIGYWFPRGYRQLPVLAGMSLMIFSAIMVQTQVGPSEVPFHTVAALAFLLIPRGWLPILGRGPGHRASWPAHRTATQ